MSLTHTILQREAPNSEKVLRRILHQDEIWYWDPSSNEIDKITSQRTKKELKREKKQRAKTEKRQKKEQGKTEKKMKKGRHAEPSASRKALATSDDACWRKAEINRAMTKSDEITLGNPTEAIEQTLGIKFIAKSKKVKSHSLHTSLSFPRMFRKSKGTQSASSASSSSSSSEDDSDSDDSTHSAPNPLKKLRLVLRHGSKSSSSSSTSTISSTTTTNFFDSSTLSGSACSSPTSSGTSTPISSPRSPTSDTTTSPTTSPRLPASSPRLTTNRPRSPMSDTTSSPMSSPRHPLSTSVGPATSPRGNRATRVRLDAGLRRSLQTPLGPNGPACSPRNGTNDSASIRTGPSPITPSARCPTPLSLEQEDSSSDDELELQSIDELTDDSASEDGTGFWVRERMHRTPSSRIPPTPYFDLILQSFDDCL